MIEYFPESLAQLSIFFFIQSMNKLAFNF